MQGAGGWVRLLPGASQGPQSSSQPVWPLRERGARSPGPLSSEIATGPASATRTEREVPRRGRSLQTNCPQARFMQMAQALFFFLFFFFFPPFLLGCSFLFPSFICLPFFFFSLLPLHASSSSFLALLLLPCYSALSFSLSPLWSGRGPHQSVFLVIREALYSPGDLQYPTSPGAYGRQGLLPASWAFEWQR